MNYVIADKEKAVRLGFRTLGHRVKGGSIILNEKEVRVSAWLSGTFAERVEQLGGEVHSNTGINNIIGEGGWQHG